MRRTLLAAVALAAAVAPSASATEPPNGAGASVAYVVTAGGPNDLRATCVVYADRLTADYGPTKVYAVASAPFGISTTVRCTVTKAGTTWVDESQHEGSGVAAITGRGAGTIPVAGIRVCVDADSQLSVDAHPYAHACIDA